MHVISTAGHVDHGKSTLIERLTGIDPDRLAEEKSRGLTIDLGFAWLELPGGREVGIVDVPGHERFIHNMLAGVASVDATLFVVAANEGWCRQSEEHLAILDLLAARGGVVALTKSDLVDAETLRAAATQVAGRLEGTPLAGAEIVPVSGTTGEGTAGLLDALERLLARIPPAPERGRARLFIDRAFSIRGAGTVVTGTLTGGRLRTGEEVAILPAGLRARVRGIQTHRRHREEAVPGSRAAVNLAGLERERVHRGDAVVTPGGWRPTDLVDVLLRTTRSLGEPLTGRGTFKLHHGSGDAGASLRLLDAREVPPRGAAYARIRLEEPIVAEAFDRFVLRDVGRRETVAGGIILDPHPVRRILRSRDRATRVRELRARESADRDTLLPLVVTERGMVAREDVPWLAGVPAGAHPSGEPHPPPGGGVVALRSWLVSRERFDDLAGRLEATLARFHAAEPLARGMPREEARAAVGITDPRLFGELLEALGGRVAAEGTLMRLATHAVTLSPEERAARDALLADVGEGFSPPSLDELAARYGRPLVRALTESGDLVEVAPSLAFSREQIERARALVAEAIAARGPATTSDLRQALGTSRKYAIPLLEHLDRSGFTRRQGDTRLLAGRPDRV